MHAVWKGTVQIAKFQIPVKLYAATEDKDVTLKMTHAACGGSISHLKYCQTCAESVEPDQIRKVYDLGGGNAVELTEEELKGIAPPSSKTFFVEQFAEEHDVGRLRMKKHYYVGSDDVGEEAFRLFHAGLLRANRVGIGYLTLRSVQSLAAIWPTEEGLVLSTMLYEDEIRPMARIRPPADAARKEAAPEAHVLVFQELIRKMTTPFVGARYANKYEAALRALIENKVARQTPKAAEEPELPGRGANLEQLLASLNTSLDSVGDAFARQDSDRTH